MIYIEPRKEVISLLGLLSKVVNYLFAPRKKKQSSYRLVRTYANKRDFMAHYYREMQREYEAVLSDVRDMFSNVPKSTDNTPVVVEQSVNKVLIVKDGHIYDESGREYFTIGDLVVA